jgi:hypothetical protein
MARVLIQAGHHPDGGGAPGEAEWTLDLAQRIARRLTAAGIETAIVGNWFNKTPPAATRQDWDLFLSLHYDAAVYGQGHNTGCFADRARGDPMGAASDRFIHIWEGIFPVGSGIALSNRRRNENTFHYYGFRATTARTPGALIEHGCGAPSGKWYRGTFYPPGEDCTFLHEHVEIVAELDARAVLTFLGVEAAPATLAALASRPGSAALVAQVREWQRLRAENGEDPHDWAACREHLVALGTPDPGSQAPADFVEPRAELLAGVAHRTGNPNLVAQVREWQTAREVRGQEPNDWAACRAHLLALGVPDPEEPEPADFAKPAATAEQYVVASPDGPANIRHGPGRSFPVATTVSSGTLLACDRAELGEDIAGNAIWHHLEDGSGWIHNSLLRPVDLPEDVTVDSTLLAPPRATLTQARHYLRARPNGGYTEEEVDAILRRYFEMAAALGLDPLLAVAQMMHETNFLSSFWSQPPRCNPAGIGVTGEPGAGIVFDDWTPAVRAHLGRLLAYAIVDGAETGVQRELIEEALRWRPLPIRLRGIAPTLRGLTGTWATDPHYSQKVSNHARSIQTLPA